MSDIKPDNILFSDPTRPESSLKLCDFGTAQITNDGRCSVHTDFGGLSPLCKCQHTCNQHTPSDSLLLSDSPPEAIHAPALQSVLPQIETAGDYDGRKFDMFSAGMVMWEMWIKERPVLERAGSILCEIDLEDSALDILSKTAAGYRPDLTVDGPFGVLSPCLFDLVVSPIHLSPYTSSDMHGYTGVLTAAFSREEAVRTRGQGHTRGT